MEILWLLFALVVAKSDFGVTFFGHLRIIDYTQRGYFLVSNNVG